MDLSQNSLYDANTTELCKTRLQVTGSVDSLAVPAQLAAVKPILADMLLTNPSARPSAKQVYRKLNALLDRTHDSERKFRQLLLEMAKTDAARCIVTGFPTQCAVGTENLFTITAADELGRARISGGDVFNVEWTSASRVLLSAVTR